MNEELATIKDVGIGMRDCNSPVLWFTVEMLHGAALQVFQWEQAAQVIEEFGVYDARNLEGRACVVTVDKGHVIYKGPK